MKFGRKKLIKRLRIFLSLITAILVLMYGWAANINTYADESIDTGKWVVNGDGSLSIDQAAADNAVKNIESNVSLILLGSTGGKITLPDDLPSNVVTKLSSAEDAALMLFPNDGKIPKEDVSNILQKVKYSSATTAINIAVTDGDTQGISVSSSDTTFGIVNSDGSAHIYKFVLFGSEKKNWDAAYSEAVSGKYTLGGFKGYLATITSVNEATLLNNFYKSVTTANEGGVDCSNFLKIFN